MRTATARGRIEPGELRILNAGAGDLRLTFRPDEPPAERNKLATLVRDMLRQGYALLVQNADGTYSRATDFDADAMAYIVEGTPALAGGETEHVKKTSRKKPTRRTKKKTTRRQPTKRRLSAVHTRAVAVARTAGG